MAEATDDVPLNPAFVDVLRIDRESLNQRFAQLQRAGARIDDAAFRRHLRTTVNSLVSGVADVVPERVRALVNALFDVSLDLFAARLLGPDTRHPHVVSAWREVLPRVTTLLARDPLQVAGCLSNAVDHLAAHASARPSEWIELMRDLSLHCDSVPLWLAAGKVVAWRAGMVQYRSDALRLARQMPWKLAARCLGAPDDLQEFDWSKCLDRLAADHWYSPATGNADMASRSLRIVRTTGDFRGLGGPCLRPPIVTVIDRCLFVSDGDATWELRADAFGTLWHRVPAPAPKSVASADASKVAIDSRGKVGVAKKKGQTHSLGDSQIQPVTAAGDQAPFLCQAGKVTWNGMHREFAELAEASSFASDAQTLAVTLPTSHHVFLVARVAT